ncbi:membrane protein insertase YidC [Candidatus Marinimicrobia bacterium]|nr:membrane protein insertase YidC [Candidatus Neomarinimicrobiota bacterium]
MDRKTLTGFILIGAILLLWPSYLELISPSEKSKEDVVTPDTSLVEKYSEQTLDDPVKTVLENPVVEEQTFIIKGKNYIAEISNVGGGSITSYTLTKHLKKSESSLNLIDGYNSNNLVVSFVNQSGEVVSLDKNWSLVSGGSANLSETSPEVSFLFTTEHLGSQVTKELSFYFDSYEIDISTSLRSLKDVSLDEKYTLSWVGGLPEHEGTQDAMFMEGLISQAGSIESFRVGAAGFFGSSSSSNVDAEEKKYVGQADFAGYRTKYFGLFFVPQKSDFVEITKYPTPLRAGVDISITQDINLEKNKLYLGPLDYSSVENLGVGLEEKILGWQWLSSVSWLVYSIMIALYSFIPNYGVVVVLFAILIKLITYPLMAKQLRSSKKMQEISPLMNQIKIKYKNNPTLQQQKMAALFQENKINPLAGCLPLLIQMPVLMSVFMVFRNTIEFRGESFVLWINDLSAADTLFVVGGIPINVLPFLMSFSMYYTMKLSSATQPAGGDPAQEATQQMMKYMFPGMMFFLFYAFPSGLNLYYLCFNIMQIVQQKIINSETTQDPVAH